MTASERQSLSADLVIAPPAVPTLAVKHTNARFPVNRIFCIGRNYAAHAVEMGHDPDKEPPFFFLKHGGAVVSDGTFPYPPESADVHHEVELVVALATGGSDIAVADALDHVFGYGVGLDMTRRDLQAEAKSLGRPWEVAKSFEASAPCGPLVPASAIGHPDQGAISLAVNGHTRQEGDLNQMLWKVPEIISTLSRFFALQPGDIIMSGTPSGVGAVSRGDIITASIGCIGNIKVDVV
ncbi:fumarylacetoacetate hydrolase family protein [Pelagibacterium sp.]|uniref:fumarylacetoacetate hydrolase family protein n=1 Tax=Pelagibacterium sp. TaxID=1967288 RepID=UPI003A90246C